MRVSFLLFIALLVAPLASAQGSLVVRGAPADAVVRVGGAVVEDGVPIPVSTETVLVRVEFANGAQQERWVTVDGSAMEVLVEPARLAVTPTTFLTPGLAQWQGGRKKTALALWTGIIGGGVAVAVGHPTYAQARDEYDVHLSAYEAAASTEQAVLAREAAADSGQRAERAQMIRNVGIGIAVAAYSIAVFDGMGSPRPRLRVQPADALTLGPSGDYPGLALRLSL